ncbi:DUF456 domain-containing protein [Legionella fairfieldensis]|uniref:DUF456 domain-containing protein n=1 Tax=Legionella fairfieldensis TaxID=45064 RepID=UPI00048D21AC|nr:DUF456 domain-containing protein [Legionella fairfieldensis]
MPFPHISAILNNCGLHACTPEIKEEILKRGADDNYHNAFDPAYTVLKDEFANFYGLKESFQWRFFSQILSSYNAFDTQIILGPVLRRVLVHFMKQDKVNIGLLASAETQTREQYIQKTEELNPANGRYFSLSPADVAYFLLEPLGFNLTYHHDNTEDHFEFGQSWPVITLYHQGGAEGANNGGHWEREANKEARVYVEFQEDTQLNAYLPLLGNSLEVTIIGLNFLKKHVALTTRAIKENLNFQAEFSNLNLTLAQIDKFIYNINHVPKEIAAILVGKEPTLLFNEFYQSWPNSTIDYNPNFVEFIKYNIGPDVKFNAEKEPAFTLSHHSEYEIALALLAPAIIPSHPVLVALSEEKISTNKKVRELRVDELSTLVKVQYILFNEGLSNALYNQCNKKETVHLLTDELIKMLRNDDKFSQKASDLLKERARQVPLEAIPASSLSTEREDPSLENLNNHPTSQTSQNLTGKIIEIENPSSEISTQQTSSADSFLLENNALTTNSQTISPPANKSENHQNEEISGMISKSLSLFLQEIKGLQDEILKNSFRRLYAKLVAEINSHKECSYAKSPYPVIIRHFTALAAEINQGCQYTQEQLIDSLSQLDKELTSRQPLSKELTAVICGVIGAVIGVLIGFAVGAALTVWAGGFGSLAAALYCGTAGFAIAQGVAAGTHGFFNAKTNEKIYRQKEGNKKNLAAEIDTIYQAINRINASNGTL